MATYVPKGKIAFFGSLKSVKFRSQATIGDVVRAEVTVTQRSKLGAKGTGKLYVSDREICSIEELTGVIGELKAGTFWRVVEKGRDHSLFLFWNKTSPEGCHFIISGTTWGLRTARISSSFFSIAFASSGFKWSRPSK